MTRVSVTNPTAGVDLRVEASGNSYAIEDCPDDLVANRNTIVPGDGASTGSGFPLISRAVVRLCASFDYLTIKGINGTSGNVTLIVFNREEEDIDIPPAA